ncbi:MAG: UDP-N-acetylglucosamine--N-acetylmuramyl-(pentapeptide) pyrophosphoryl-undecaprenol N-acetylglucosamine transferase [Pseudomonadota bacterium]
MSRLLVIAAGGTGGHMFPAQALAEAMLARGWRVMLATDARGLRYAEGFPAEVERLELRAATPGQGGLTAKLAAPTALARGVIQALMAFRRARPAMVAGFGGYPAFPAMAAAVLLGVPRLIHEQNGVLGRVNRLFAPLAKVVACGIWPVENAPARARLDPVGNPVRAAVLEAAQPFVLPGDGPVRLLVVGGSQGASVFASLVPGAVTLLPEAMRTRLQVTQQTRGDDGPAVEAAYRTASVAAETAPFFTDLPARMAAAHLVIARAGASTIAELGVIGRPAILVPYPHAAADHQTANARAQVEAGAAILAPEAGLTTSALGAHIRAALNPDRLPSMAEAARATGRADATETLVRLVEEHARPG